MFNFFPLIVFISYAIILTLFILVGVLNIKDMEIKKRDRWVKKDSIAMLIKVLFYGFLITFAIVELEALIFSFSNAIFQFLTGKKLPIRISLLSLLLPIIPVILTGIIYGIAKKREWYELIDEEE
ncbi:MAG: hypothetical protein QXL69_07155 [Candidatus Bathyarchaeia archaeon]|nr:hypothetical protein [Candidatus Bathyarchaeota archaeon]